MNAETRDSGFFTETLASRDPEVANAIGLELGRQRDEIELIASENIVSAAVMEAQLIQRALPVLGLPGLAVATGTADGAPVGVQLMASKYREDVLFEVGAAIEAACGAPQVETDI